VLDPQQRAALQVMAGAPREEAKQEKAAAEGKAQDAAKTVASQEAAKPRDEAKQEKAAEAKAKQKIIEIKEVKFRPGADEGDYNIKMRNLRRFIAEDGDKGKVTLRYRGREITHQDIGMRLLERIRDELADVAVVEHMPKLEGRQMIMVLAPKRK